MASTQRVTFPDGERTHTVVGPDNLPIGCVEDYLAFLRDTHASPNTVRSYAAGLAAWFTLLEARDASWTDFPTSLFGDFLRGLSNGDQPGVSRIGPATAARQPATVQLRAAAVQAFYRWHAETNHLTVPYGRLFTASTGRHRSPYRPFLTGIATTTRDRPIHRVRHGNRSRQPLLTPQDVRTITDACAVQRPDGSWTGKPSGLRDRLLFVTLIETGMRLGEALSLRHCDWNIGNGGTPYLEVVPRQDHPRGERVKSRTDRRIYIGADLAALYAEYAWQLVDLGADLAVEALSKHFVFVNLSAGERFAPMSADSTYSKCRSITKHHPQLPPGWSPHWFRHTHATSLLLAGVPPHVVMRRLGHKDHQTTLSLYGWVTEDAELRTLADWRSFTAGWGSSLPAAGAIT